MFGSALFVLIVLIFYVVLNSIPSAFLINVFGALNVVAIWLLFGWESVVVLSMLTCCLWLSLFVVKISGLQKNKNGFIRATVFLGLLTFILSLIFLSDIVNAWTEVQELQEDSLISYLLVLGLGYFGLRMWDCVFSVMEGGQPLINPVALFGYLIPFYMVMAGPITPYQDHINSYKLRISGTSFSHFIDCLLLISTGYAMKFFFAELYQVSVAGTNSEWSLITIWDTWIYLVYILLEFWGYSLIALGVGRMIGIATPVNFNYPFLAVTFGEFWTRWHMSLGAFVSRNIYNPIMLFFVRRFGSERKNIFFACNLFSLWLPFVFVGLWHHISWGFFLWGLAVGFLVALEKAIFGLPLIKSLNHNKKSRSVRYFWKLTGVIYTQAMVAVTLTIAISEFV